MLQFIQLFLLVWSAMLMPSVGSSLWDGIKPGHIVFRQHGLCASGKPGWYGLIEPEELLDNSSLFVEMMGGAICFNHASCTNRELRLWTDIDEFLVGFVGLDAPVIGYLKSGVSIPLGMMLQIRAGYMPTEKNHPGYGKRAIFMPMCTADIFVGKHNATYEPPAVPTSVSKNCDETKTGDAVDYKGCQNYTRTGMACEKWSVQGARFSVGDHNYCRNPDGESTIWCYTENKNVRWDYCDAATEAPQPKTFYHHGGKSFSTLLQEIKKEMPHLKEISIYGASGGGVAATAWSSVIADIWTEAKVMALADGSMHVFPGTELFDYFWEKSKYGPGPVGKATPQYDVVVPDFDWRQADALAKHLASHEGRVKLAYMSCIDDSVVYGDRATMSVFAGLDSRMQSLLNASTQHDRTWAFLNSLHSCSPEASVFSYILACTTHHFTRNGWEPAMQNPGTNISVKDFAARFLSGLNPQGATTKFWYDGHPAKIEGTPSCPSEVRRRRGMATRTPTPTPTPVHTEGVDQGTRTNVISGFSLVLMCACIVGLPF